MIFRDIIKNNKIKNKIISKTRLTPKTYLKDVLFKKKNIGELPKKRKKISNDDFEIPEFKDYVNIKTINYNVSQLKVICKHYKQKKSGNKKQLINLLYNYLYYSYHTIRIQKLYKGYLRRRLNKLRGPAMYNKKCINETDFFTLEYLKDLPNKQFYSFKDIDDFLYGFDICSLYNMLAIEKCDKNPYNRKKLPINTLDNLLKIIKLGRITNENPNIILEDNTNELPKKKQTELRAISLFQKIDENGFITNADWFLNLNRDQLRRFLKELLDIWQYRAQLSTEAKRTINPQHGDPFFSFNIPVLLHKCFEVMQNRILDIIEVFITKGENLDGRSLGTYYVLGALTIVCSNAAASLPWLYESFMPNIN